jgi:hypothetical protein
MLKRMMGLAIVVLAAWGGGCSSAPAPEVPPQWSAIKFVPQEAPETVQGREAKPSVPR